MTFNKRTFYGMICIAFLCKTGITHAENITAPLPLFNDIKITQNADFLSGYYPELMSLTYNQDPVPVKIIDTHALSLLGDVKYGEHFKHFDYVNIHAPKGGEIILSGGSGFDTLNHLNGQGEAAAGMKLIYDTLMEGSLDEPASEYGLIAQRLRYPDNYAWVEYDLRPQAKWSDGKPITPEDVIFSLDILKTKGDPMYRYYYANILKAEKRGTHTVRFTFDKAGNRELPLITGQLTILPKHYWQNRDFSKASLIPPLGSGPYMVGKIIPNRSITFVRNPNYWAKDLPINQGTYNFNKIRFEMYRDTTVQFEAFKSGAYDFRIENSAKNWATSYNFPDVKKGLVKKATFKNLHPKPMQGLIFNLRKNKFQDKHLREALNLTLDFEWLNKNLFYNSYKRSQSFFEQSELAAMDLPDENESALLKPYKNQLPADIFTQKPTNYNAVPFRERMRMALNLLKKSGYSYQDGKLFSPAGHPVSIEILNSDAFFERILLPIAENMKKLGVNVIIRTVDQAQYMRRLQKFDFDMTMMTYAQSSSPGNEQREYWSSESAHRDGSRNYAGLKNHVVDKMVQEVIFSENRTQLVSAVRALDRLLQSERLLIPLWYAPEDRIAYRNKFGLPTVNSTYGAGGQINLWWALKP